jgi:SAM-dependent methyltransferase
MASSGISDEIQQRHLGLPDHLLSTSLLTWDGIAEVTEALELTHTGTLLDLACGRGGYGLEVARRTGVRLIGVDFSAEALRQARQQAARLRREAEFRVGDLTATGLEAGSVTGVLCVDAVQFAEPTEAAFAEMRRVLAPGGRAVLTGWEALDRADDRVSARLRRTDFAAALAGAGFADVQVLDRSTWRERERAMWAEAAALDPGSDPSLRSFHDEGVRVLETFPLIRRVLAIGVVPV